MERNVRRIREQTNWSSLWLCHKLKITFWERKVRHKGSTSVSNTADEKKIDMWVENALIIMKSYRGVMMGWLIEQSINRKSTVVLVMDEKHCQIWKIAAFLCRMRQDSKLNVFVLWTLFFLQNDQTTWLEMEYFGSMIEQSINCEDEKEINPGHICVCVSLMVGLLPSCLTSLRTVGVCRIGARDYTGCAPKMQ